MQNQDDEIKQLKAEVERLKADLAATCQAFEQISDSHGVRNVIKERDRYRGALARIDSASWKWCASCENTSEYAYNIARAALEPQTAEGEK